MRQARFHALRNSFDSGLVAKGSPSISLRRVLGVEKCTRYAERRMRSMACCAVRSAMGPLGGGAAAGRKGGAACAGGAPQ